jgi:hypothetical protein
MSDPVMVHLRHLTQATQCRKGARAFFARHGLDWGRFRREGLPAEVIEATGDAMAMATARLAREEASRGR